MWAASLPWAAYLAASVATYSGITCAGVPSATTRPFSSCTMRWHSGGRASRLWVTMTVVRPSRLSFMIRSRLRRWKSKSPTDRTSSTRITSASLWDASAKPRRASIPDE